MTYSELLSDVYANYEKLLSDWDSETEKAENIGVFAFFPEDYSSATSLSETEYTYWTMPAVREYLEAGGQTDDGFMDLLQDFGLGEEFLVMIVEYVGEEKKHIVHIHKITKVGLN